jgi:hypothetical protein
MFSPLSALNLNPASAISSPNFFTLGNYMFSCALRLEAHYFGENCAIFSELSVTDPSIQVRSEADAKDARNWFITAPTEPSRKVSGRRQTGIRWISPWVTEARGLETSGRVVDIIQRASPLDDEQFFFVHIAVNHRSNVEVGLICASVVIFENALCELMHLPPPARGAPGNLLSRVLQIVKACEEAGDQGIPQLDELMPRPGVRGAPKLTHLRFLTNTHFKSAKRALIVELGPMNPENLALRAAFLAFFVCHCAKKMSVKLLQDMAGDTIKSVSNLISFVDSLPSSMVRALTRPL